MSVAEDRLSSEVLRLPNLIRLVNNGLPDTVIRIAPFPSKTLWLDRGPDIEEWERIKREVFIKAPAEQKLPTPVPVGDYKSWNLTPEMVPFIDLTPKEDKKDKK